MIIAKSVLTIIIIVTFIAVAVMRRAHFHWSVYVGIGMLVALVLWIIVAA
jgi:hypothetical protein